MTTVTVDVCIVTEPVEHRCPICGEILDPDRNEVLCAGYEADQAEKWADYCAEQAQAWHPY